MNINEVELAFTGGGGSRFGDFVASFVYGTVGGDVIIGSEELAVDHNLSTIPRFGRTSSLDLSDRFRLTIGFTQPVP